MRSVTRLVAAATAVLAVAAAAQDKLELNTITKVQVSGGTITIIGSKKPNFTTFTMTDPARLVIDISEAVFSGVQDEQQVGNGVVTAIKTASYGSDASAIARVLIGFDKEFETDIQTADTRLVVKVLGAGAASEPVAVAQADKTAPAQPAGPSAAEKAAAEKAAAEQAAKDKAAADKAAAAQAAADKAAADKAAKEQAAAEALAKKEAERQAKEQAEAERKAAAEQKRQEAEAAKQAAAEEKKRKQEEAAAAAFAKKQEQEAARQAALDEKKRKAEEAAALAEQKRQEAEAAKNASAEEKKQKAEEAAAAREAARQEQEAARQAAAEEKQRKAEEAAAAREAKKQEAAAAREQQRLAMAETRSEGGSGESAEASSNLSVSGRRKTMTFVGFRQDPGTQRVYVRTNEPVRYSVSRGGNKKVVLELENTSIALSNNTRFLDTSSFIGVVAMVQPRRGPTQTVRVEIDLKEDAPYEARQEGNEVYVDFQSGGRR